MLAHLRSGCSGVLSRVSNVRPLAPLEKGTGSSSSAPAVDTHHMGRPRNNDAERWKKAALPVSKILRLPNLQICGHVLVLSHLGSKKGNPCPSGIGRLESVSSLVRLIIVFDPLTLNMGSCLPRGVLKESLRWCPTCYVFALPPFQACC